MTPEQKLMQDLIDIVGTSATKLASAKGQDLAQAVPGTTKVASLAEMSLEDIMRDPNFIAGMNYELDKIAAEWVPDAKEIFSKVAEEKGKKRKAAEETETRFPSRWRSFSRGAQLGALAGGATGAGLGAASGVGGAAVVNMMKDPGFQQLMPEAQRGILRAAMTGKPVSVAGHGLLGGAIGGLGGAAAGALGGGIKGLLTRHMVRPERVKKEKK